MILSHSFFVIMHQNGFNYFGLEIGSSKFYFNPTTEFCSESFGLVF